MTVSAVDPIQADIRSTVTRIRALIDGASDAQLAAASPLPEWTRAHVAGHIAGFSHAMARQWEYALLGELIEQYTGGIGGRDAEIEAFAALEPDALRVAVGAALDRLCAAMAAMTDWTLPISYREGRAVDGLEGAWRELTIHLSDLDLGVDVSSWSDAFCGHLFAFLPSRLPGDVVLILDDGTRVGAGTTGVRVHGSLQDVAAWLAGRAPVGELGFDPSPPPELGPWPARKN